MEREPYSEFQIVRAMAVMLRGIVDELRNIARGRGEVTLDELADRIEAMLDELGIAP